MGLSLLKNDTVFAGLAWGEEGKIACIRVAKPLLSVAVMGIIIISVAIDIINAIIVVVTIIVDIIVL